MQLQARVSEYIRRIHSVKQKQLRILMHSLFSLFDFSRYTKECKASSFKLSGIIPTIRANNFLIVKFFIINLTFCSIRLNKQKITQSSSSHVHVRKSCSSDVLCSFVEWNWIDRLSTACPSPSIRSFNRQSFPIKIYYSVYKTLNSIWKCTIKWLLNYKKEKT